MSNSIVVVGTPTAGFAFHGPFQDETEALKWSSHHGDGPTFVSEIEEPEDAVLQDDAEQGHPLERQPSLVITGNPVDGLFFYGPFPDPNTAGEWAAIQHQGQDWWVSKLQADVQAEFLPSDSPSL